MATAETVNLAYLRAALVAWEYFDKRGPYMTRALRDALTRCGVKGKDEREALAVLRRVVDGESFPTPAVIPGGELPARDKGLSAIVRVMGTALKAVPGAWDEFVTESEGRD